MHLFSLTNKSSGIPMLNHQRRPPVSFFRLYIPQTQTCLSSPIEAKQVFRFSR